MKKSIIKISITTIMVIQFIVIICIWLLYVKKSNSVSEITLINSYMSPDEIHKVLLYEIEETKSLGMSSIWIKVASNYNDKRECRPYYIIELPIKGVPDYSNFHIEWIDGGVIIRVINVAGYSRKYRILWKDVFWEDLIGLEGKKQNNGKKYWKEIGYNNYTIYSNYVWLSIVCGRM